MSSINNTTALIATINPLVAAYNYYSTSKSIFANIPPEKVLGIQDQKQTQNSVGSIIATIIIFVIIILIMYYSSKAVYNLTDSLLQTICCFLFGVFYLYFAVLYYGLSGYKYKLSNSSSNSNSRN